jgi:hypothetical protein
LVELAGEGCQEVSGGLVGGSHPSGCRYAVQGDLDVFEQALEVLAGDAEEEIRAGPAEVAACFDVRRQDPLDGVDRAGPEDVGDWPASRAALSTRTLSQSIRTGPVGDTTMLCVLKSPHDKAWARGNQEIRAGGLSVFRSSIPHHLTISPPWT